MAEGSLESSGRFFHGSLAVHMMCVPADRRPITARRFSALSAAPARTPLRQDSPSRFYAVQFGCQLSAV